MNGNWTVLGFVAGLIFASVILIPKQIYQQEINKAYNKRLKIGLRPYVKAKQERNCLKARDLKLQDWYKWNTPDSLVCQCAKWQ